MISMGGCRDLSRNVNIYRVAASIMRRYAEYPSCDNWTVCFGVAPWVIMSWRLLGPRMNPTSIWKVVPGRNCSWGLDLRLGVLCNLARSQNGHRKKLLSDGKVGIPSTTLLVFRRVLGAGCPSRWCHISSCLTALERLLFHVLVRGARVWVFDGGSGLGL